MRISDWSSDVCSSDLRTGPDRGDDALHLKILEYRFEQSRVAFKPRLVDLSRWPFGRRREPFERGEPIVGGQLGLRIGSGFRRCRALDRIGGLGRGAVARVGKRAGADAWGESRGH